jgi:hypothetical protein
MTVTTNAAATIAGKASASTSAVTGARPNKINAKAGAAVTRKSAVTTNPAAWSKPLVAASDPDIKVARAAKIHAAASRMHAMIVAVRSFVRPSSIVEERSVVCFWRDRVVDAAVAAG